MTRAPRSLTQFVAHFVAVFIALLIGLCSTAAAQNRAHLADIELVGPVSGVVLDVGRLGSTRIEGELRAGETRRLSVPVPIDADVARTDPIVRFDDAQTELEPRGRVRFLGWSKGPSPLAPLTAGLRARTLPALSEADVRASRAAPFVLVAALVAILALRRRPWLALVCALLAALAMQPLVSSLARETETMVTLLDGDDDNPIWRRIDAAIGEVAVEEGIDAIELTCEPNSAAITWLVPLDTSRAWRARAPGARLFVTSVFTVGEEHLSQSKNTQTSFDRTWVRDEGEWSARGPWPFDSALPKTAANPDAEPPSPPGWLATHLPQGVPMLIAREVVVPRRPVVWVRVSGIRS